MDLTQELFQSIKLIVEHELSQQKTTSTIIGTVIEKVSSSEAYKVSYQNIEIIASSLGGIYSPGDSVYILLPNGVLGDVKFIVGKTNDRTPTVAKSGNGLSDSTMSMIQNIINSFTEWSSDNSISPIEKASLALQWETIKSSYAEALVQAKEYPEVPVITLINKYDNLKRLVEPLLSNMGTTSSLNGEELRLALGEYLSEDSAVRLLVQEELRKELVYKTTIVSSGGNSFKNGIIDTTLSTISMRGRKNIDEELKSNQIRWTKLSGDGSEEVGSETFGFTREINSDDVHVKQIFKVEIIIGGIIVAQDYITLVDINDIENIDLTITTGGSTKQIFNPDTNTIIPDYTKENQVMFARVFKGKEDLSQIADIKWFCNGTPIVSDGRFLVEGYKLTILKNLTNTENPVILIKCSASYYSSEYQMVLEDEEVTEFLLISNGSNGETGSIGPAGIDGKDGIPGKPGQDGRTSYSHIAWADSDDGQIGFSTKDSADKEYIGFYSDFIEEDSEDPSKYGWSLIRGRDGSAGTPGKPGEDGKTPYFHTAWANSADGQSGFSTTVATGKSYIGTYVDFIEPDSEDPSDYDWLKTKGESGRDGSDGAPGKDGIGLSSTVITYAGSDSGSIAPSKGWTESIPVLAPGKYLWMKTTWAYTDNTIEDGYTVSRIGKDGNTGKDGIAGKDGVGLESTVITYVESTSGTATPSSGWSEIIPSVSNGRYLWTRTAWNYTDGTSEEAYSVSKMGETGPRGSDGIAGKDGVGLKRTDIRYSSSINGTTPPESGWTEQVPVVSPNQYLWTRTTWTYTDDSDEVGYSVSKIGKDGNNGSDGIAGKDGVGLRSTEVHYSASSGGTIIPTAGWGLTIPNVPEGQFLWTRTTWTYTDNTNEKGYSVSRIGQDGKDGNNGKDGIAGKDGVGIKTTVVNYASGTNGVTAPSTGWGLEVPTVAAGNFLWTRTVWTYTDNTSETGYSVARIGKDGNTGKDGIAGKDGVGLHSTKIEYVGSTSGTTAPTSGWGPTVPTVAPGTFLWTRTIWIYTDNTTETGYSVARMGSNGAKGDTGADGIAGKDGVGLKSTTITYGLSTADTTQPTTYTSEVPPLTKGQYLWTKTIWAYTDGTSETGYTKTYIAKDGNSGTNGLPGKDGVGIKSTVITYGQSTNGSSYAGITWTSAIPTVTPGNFLWTKTVWTYTDNTSETGYSVSRSGKDGNTGKDGIAGKDGKGITSTTITYGLSTTDTVEPTKYTSSVPTLVKGQYLWTKTVWKYTDNTTETGYTKTYIAKDGNNGSNGIAGKDGVGISKTTITYTKSTNGTTAPTTGYTTAVPSANPGDYIWTKTVWTYTDNTSETGYSVGKIGNTGATGATGASGKDGIAGKDGKGIKSTVIDYATSASGTTKPATDKWGPTVPSLTKGQYLWTRTIWTYTDSTTETGYSVSYIAKDGNNGTNGIAGKDGVGISSTKIEYAGSTSGTTKPTSGWGPAVPTVAPGNFLWTKTTWTYTDNTTETGYSVARMGVNGAKGDTGPKGATGATGAKGATGDRGPVGATGTSVSSVTEYYLATSTSSGIKDTDTRFTTAMQPLTATNKYLWNYEKINFSNGTSQPTIPVIIGVYGDKGQTGSTGATGRSIVSIQENYLATSASSGVTRSTSGWTTTMQPTTETNKYLWNYEKITWSSAPLTTYVDPIIIGVHGAKGPQGSTGPKGATGSQGPKGAQGPQGIQGPAGANGKSQYTHIRYSANSNGSGMDPKPSSTTKYIGIAVTNSATAPTNTGFTWSKYIGDDGSRGPQGPQGTQGVRGPAGANGQPTYTWVKYANDKNGGGMSDYPEGKRFIGLAFNKTTATESATASHYTWSLMPQNIEVGAKNLLLKSNEEITNSSYPITTYQMSEKMIVGQEYTLRLWGTLGSGKTNFTPYLNGGSISLGALKNNGDGTFSATFVGKDSGVTTGDTIHIYPFPSTTVVDSTITKIKLEKGSIATDWTEAPEDIQARLSEKADQNQVNNALEDINESLEDKIAREEFEKLEKIATEFAKSYEAFVSEGGQYVEDAAKLEERFTQIFFELGANTIDLQFLNTYFRAGEEGLLIGSEDSQIKMLLTNGRLSFQEGSGDNIKEIAYFGGQSFTINSGAIVQDFQIGEHKFTNIGGGHTIVQWTTK